MLPYLYVIAKGFVYREFVFDERGNVRFRTFKNVDGARIDRAGAPRRSDRLSQSRPLALGCLTAADDAGGHDAEHDLIDQLVGELLPHERFRYRLHRVVDEERRHREHEPHGEAEPHALPEPRPVLDAV